MQKTIFSLTSCRSYPFYNLPKSLVYRYNLTLYTHDVFGFAFFSDFVPRVGCGKSFGSDITLLSVILTTQKSDEHLGWTSNSPPDFGVALSTELHVHSGLSSTALMPKRCSVGALLRQFANNRSFLSRGLISRSSGGSNSRNLVSTGRVNKTLSVKFWVHSFLSPG